MREKDKKVRERRNEGGGEKSKHRKWVHKGKGL